MAGKMLGCCGSKVTWIVAILGVVIAIFGLCPCSDEYEPETLESTYVDASSSSPVNPCCSFPCQNEGVCMNYGKSLFACDCTGTGHSGAFCQKPSWGRWLSKTLKPGPETVHGLVSGSPWLWNIINSIDFARRFVMRTVLHARISMVDLPPLFRAGRDYTSLEGFLNTSYYSQTLPPVPEDCPTPMGVTGPKTLPSIQEVVDALFKRKEKKFYPNDIKSNVLFASFAQHFTHMFIKSDPFDLDPSITWSDHNLYLSHIYGQDKDVENRLREMKGGRMKTQMINGEEYPPFTKDVHIEPVFNPTKVENQFASGHWLTNFLPTTALWQILYLREHNRVAKIFSEEFSHWDDEKVFQTTKLVLIGQTLKFVVEDYIQHLSNYNFKFFYDPTILHEKQVQYQNRIAIEFNILYHWHPFMSDSYTVAGKKLTLEDVFLNGTRVMDFSSRDYVEGMVKSMGGALRAHNYPDLTLKAAHMALQASRGLRIQPFNQYRKRFGLEPFTTFEEIAGDDKDLAKTLKDLYKDVDAVEFYIGMIVEQHRPRSMYGSTMMDIGSPYSLQGIFGNALSSPQLWRPATFGGPIGFKMVKEATLKSFMCRNLPKPCPLIKFSMPTEEELENHKKAGE